jgi:hypothetical protein
MTGNRTERSGRCLCGAVHFTAAGEPLFVTFCHGFCPRCGTSLTFESTRWPDDIHLMVGNFDAPADFVPQCHVFAGERLPWLHVSDGLPRYRTVPSAGDLLEEPHAGGPS